MMYIGAVDPRPAAQPARAAFLLSQLGALASARFAERTGALQLTPGEAGVLRLLGRRPGLSQRGLADRLGAVPSRVVALIDALETRGLVARSRNTSDRRSYELRLTEQGARTLERLRRIAEEHEAELLRPLNDDEAAQLRQLLARLVAGHGLDTDLHQHTGR
jgi:DNA-binding MarR family transcriptional regulator